MDQTVHRVHFIIQTNDDN